MEYNQIRHDFKIIKSFINVLFFLVGNIKYVHDLNVKRIESLWRKIEIREG